MRVSVNQKSVEVKQNEPTIRTLLAGNEMPDKSVVVAGNGDVCDARSGTRAGSRKETR